MDRFPAGRPPLVAKPPTTTSPGATVPLRRRGVLLLLGQLGLGAALSGCVSNNNSGSAPTPQPGGAPEPAATVAPAGSPSAAVSLGAPTGQPSPVSGAAPLPLGAP